MSILYHHFCLVLLTNLCFGAGSLQAPRCFAFFHHFPAYKIFVSNVKSCITTLQAQKCLTEKQDDIVLQIAELAALLCICTEQTFSQASAIKEEFSGAFSIALNAYIVSGVRDDVNHAIRELWREGMMVDQSFISQLYYIIDDHRLRISAT